MKIYLAGNTPDRVKQEKMLTKKGLNKKRLISFYFIITDKGVKGIFDYWKTLC